MAPVKNKRQLRYLEDELKHQLRETLDRINHICSFWRLNDTIHDACLLHRAVEWQPIVIPPLLRSAYPTQTFILSAEQRICNLFPGIEHYQSYVQRAFIKFLAGPQMKCVVCGWRFMWEYHNIRTQTDILRRRRPNRHNVICPNCTSSCELELQDIHRTSYKFLSYTTVMSQVLARVEANKIRNLARQ